MTIQMTGADVIDMAVQTETRGEQFYRQAAQAAEHPEARSLFEYLATEEARHRAVFSGLSAGIVAAEIDPQTWAEALLYIEATVDRAFFRGAGAPLKEIPAGADEADLLRQAIAFEKETLLFFLSLHDLVQPNSQRLIDDIVREERSHVVSLAKMLAEVREA
ncbi:MAG: ferritin family protein [Chloroflexi bacterium]|nr:ferritin family protein [Chloroflexota bacterium]